MRRRLFGTNGVRGVVNEDMTADLALRLAHAFGIFLRGGPVVVGTDTRVSGPMLRGAAVSGLLAAGCEVVDVGMVPTPCLQYAVKARAVGGGLMVTASHNPPEYNGIKCMDATGMELSRKDEQAVESLYFRGPRAMAPWQNLHGVTADAHAVDRYLHAIAGRVDAAAIRRAGLRIVVDCANGASCFTSPRLVRSLGCEVVTLHGDPDGTFPGHPPEPTEDHLRALKDAVVDAEADLGVAHDGDADRAVFVDERGRFVYGDRTLALVAGRVVRERRGGLVVTPVSSSRVVEDVVTAAGGTVRYTRVGAPVVARAMLERKAVFGGEENGGLIFPEHQLSRDGAMSLAKVLEILAKSRRKLSGLLNGLPRYEQVKRSVPCPTSAATAVIRALRERYREERVDTTDGLKVRRDVGWFLVRPSGTEAILRIFAEAKTRARAEALAEEARAETEKLLRAVG